MKMEYVEEVDSCIDYAADDGNKNKLQIETPARLRVIFERHTEG